MDERVVQFRVGVMVIATILITFIMVLLFNELPVFTSRIKVYIALPQAPGVTPDTPVRKNGVLVGRVTNVEIMPESGVLVTAELQADQPLFENEVARVRSGLLGDAVIELVAGPEQVAQPVPLKNDDRLPGVVQGDPLEAFSNIQGDLSTAITSFAGTSDEVRTLVRRVNDLLQANDNQLTRIIDNTEQAVTRLSQTADNINRIVGDPQVRDGILRAAESLPQTIEEVRTAVGGLKTTLELADRNLENIEGLTKPLGERGNQIIGNIERATGQLDVVINELATFTQAINRPDGSLGQLLSNPDLYRQVTSAVENVNDITIELKPILNDVRAFTDKVSRHPELLGVRGALRPSSGIK